MLLIKLRIKRKREETLDLERSKRKEIKISQTIRKIYAVILPKK
jgi:hypothetical protein